MIEYIAQIYFPFLELSNPGIAKKGGGGLTHAKIFWWICRSIPKTLLRHHSTKIMIIYPQKVSIASKHCREEDVYNRFLDGKSPMWLILH